MQDPNLDYFYEKEVNRSEAVIASIECLHEGNPFIGTLILTDHRLVFVRKMTPGFEILSIKSCLIRDIQQRIDAGIDLILIVKLDKFSQEFELRGIDMASKRVFIEKIEHQFDLCGDNFPTTDRNRPTNQI